MNRYRVINEEEASPYKVYHNGKNPGIVEKIVLTSSNQNYLLSKFIIGEIWKP